MQRLTPDPAPSEHDVTLHEYHLARERVLHFGIGVGIRGAERDESLQARREAKLQVLREVVDRVSSRGHEVSERDQVPDVDQSVDGRELIAPQDTAHHRLDGGAKLTGLRSERPVGLAPGVDSRLFGHVLGVHPGPDRFPGFSKQLDELGIKAPNGKALTASQVQTQLTLAGIKQARVRRARNAAAPSTALPTNMGAVTLADLVLDSNLDAEKKIELLRSLRRPT